MPRSARRTSRTVASSHPLQLPTKLASLLQKPEDAETRFMIGWIARFHSDPPNLYVALDARLKPVSAGGRLRRVIVEAARFHPRYGAAAPEWLIIRWCIDGPGVSFERCPSRRAALTRLDCELAGSDLVYSQEPGSEHAAGVEESPSKAPTAAA